MIFVFGGFDVGLLLGLFIASSIIFYFGGWVVVFYLFGVFGFFWGVWWFIFYMCDFFMDMKEVEIIGVKKGFFILWVVFVRNS